MEYKYELHCHTGCVSDCGRVEPEEIVRLYKEKGYSGIVVTDHYSPLTFKPDKLLKPQKHTDFYLSGYRRMKAAAGDGFTVLLGTEVRHYGTANDFLVYGTDEDFFYNSGNMLLESEKSIYRRSKKLGYLVFQAHPFRPFITRCNPDFIDGVEVFNGKAAREMNRKAHDWAKSTGKLMCSGSDFHTPKQLGRGGIITNAPINSNSDLLEVLRAQDFTLIENY
jgi:hypothetical protein